MSMTFFVCVSDSVSISQSVYIILDVFYCHLDIHYILCGSSHCATQLFSYSINRNRRIHLLNREKQELVFRRGEGDEEKQSK